MESMEQVLSSASSSRGEAPCASSGEVLLEVQKHLDLCEHGQVSVLRQGARGCCSQTVGRGGGGLRARLRPCGVLPSRMAACSPSLMASCHALPAPGAELCVWAGREGCSLDWLQ